MNDGRCLLAIKLMNARIIQGFFMFYLFKRCCIVIGVGLSIVQHREFTDLQLFVHLFVIDFLYVINL